MKRTTPFKASSDFEKELTDFSKRYKTILADHAKRISDYFEMSCYNFIIKYYEKKGYVLSVQNLQGGKFKFKCSPTGLLSNFSYFKAVKKEDNEEVSVFYIYHNATVQSSFDASVYTTPDIVVSKTNKPSETDDYYSTSNPQPPSKNEIELKEKEATQKKRLKEVKIATRRHKIPLPHNAT